MYLSFKSKVRSIINKHFPPELSKRFTLYADSQIWLPKEDEGVWLRKKHNAEAMHILFDGLEIFEIPQSLDPRYAEVYFLKAFKQALIDKKISITKVKEWSDNKIAKVRKKEKQVKKKKALEDSFEYALHHPASVEYKNVKLPTGDKEVLVQKGGD